MKRILSTAVAVKLSALLLALAAPGAALAQTYVYADCSLQSNACFGEGDSPGAAAPLTLVWSFQSDGTDAIFENCHNQTSCRFYCPRYPGTFPATLTLYDANFVALGSSSTTATCTQQDIVLP